MIKKLFGICQAKDGCGFWIKKVVKSFKWDLRGHINRVTEDSGVEGHLICGDQEVSRYKF